MVRTTRAVLALALTAISPLALPGLVAHAQSASSSVVFSGEGWTINVPPSWTSDTADCSKSGCNSDIKVGGVNASCSQLTVEVTQSPEQALDAALAEATASSKPAVSSTTVDNQPGYLLDYGVAPINGGAANFGAAMYLWIDGGQEWTVGFLGVCDPSSDLAGYMNTMKTVIWPTFRIAGRPAVSP